MRKIFFVLAVSAFVLSSCGTKKAEQKEGVHVHADGTVHEAHGTTDHAKPAQEAYDVKDEHACSKECSKDSCKTKTECTEVKHAKETESHEHHDHDHDHGHQH